MTDEQCGQFLDRFLADARASGMSEAQLIGTLLGSACGLAVRHGWPPAEVARVALGYAELFAKVTQSTVAGEC